MIVTEREARARWCPFARSFDVFGNDIPVTINRNRHGEGDWDCRCLASGCMAWRLVEDRSGYGYCGLAGQPMDVWRATLQAAREERRL